MSRLTFNIFGLKLRGVYAVVAMSLAGGFVGLVIGALGRLLLYAIALAIAAAIKSRLKAAKAAIGGEEEGEEPGEGDENGEDGNGDDDDDEPKPDPGPDDDPPEDRRVRPGLSWDVGKMEPSGVEEGPRPTGMVTKAVGGNERESPPVAIPSVAKDSGSRAGRGKKRTGTTYKPTRNR